MTLESTTLAKQSESDLHEAFGARCEYCGNFHHGWCPRVAAIEYHPNGAVKRVELR